MGRPASPGGQIFRGGDRRRQIGEPLGDGGHERLGLGVLGLFVLYRPQRLFRAGDAGRQLGAGSGELADLGQRDAEPVRAALIDQRRADRLGIPLAQIGQFSGPGAQLSARIAGAEKSLRTVQDKKPKDAETKAFVAAITERLADLSAAVTAAENLPAGRRRAAHAAISSQLEGIEADLMARLGLS